jgi:hypothetical protein
MRTASTLKIFSREDLMFTEPEATELQMLVDGWLQARCLIRVTGPGGTHKSRLLKQVCMCLKYGYSLFSLNQGPTAQRGVDVKHIEYLSGENSPAEDHRRANAMAKRMGLKQDAKSDCTMKIWPLKKTRRAILVVEEKPDQNGRFVYPTAFGLRVLKRWWSWRQKNKGHMVLVLDSLVNLVVFKGNTLNLRECTKQFVETMDHWCEVLDCTILAPFHPTRAGMARGDGGHSPELDDRGRQVISVRRKTTGIGQHRHVIRDKFEIEITKWNDGPEGKTMDFEYERGVLIPCSMATMNTDPVKVAAEIAITYGYDWKEAQALLSPDTSEVERAAIETRNQKHGRITKQGFYSKQKITTSHVMIERFREKTGQPRALVPQFLEALEKAALLVPPLLVYRPAPEGSHDIAGYGAPAKHPQWINLGEPVSAEEEF